MKTDLIIEIKYLAWNYLKWKASLGTNPDSNNLFTFTHTGLDVHTDTFIGYIAYNGEQLKAFTWPKEGKVYFKHMHEDGRAHEDIVIRFLGWDGVSQWMASIIGVEGANFIWKVEQTA